MEIKYATISPNQAREFQDFLLPHIREDEDFERFIFHIAIVDGRMAGMLAESATLAEPEIKSIAVSPVYQGKGVASGLIEYVIKEMRARVRDEDLDIENSVNVRLAGPTATLGGLRRLFEKAGFNVYHEGSFYTVPLFMLKGNPVLQDKTTIEKTKKMIAERLLLPLSDVSAEMTEAFSNKLMEEESFPGIDSSILDKNLTYFGVKNGKIESCILFTREKDTIFNLLLYIDHNKAGFDMPVYLLTAASIAALSRYPSKISFMFWIGEKNTSIMMSKILPDARPVTDVVEMELAL